MKPDPDRGTMRTALAGAMLLSLLAILWLAEPPLGLALDEVTVSTTGPSIFFLPAEVARQQGFFVSRTSISSIL